MNPRLAVVSLWTEDLPTTIHFYRDILNLPLTAHPGHIPHFDAGGLNLVLLQGRPRPPLDADPPEFPLIALEISPLEEAIRRLESHQVPLVGQIVQRPQARWILCRDPGGNLIELVEFGGGE